MATAELRLNLPWIPPDPTQLDGGLTIRRDRNNVLEYDDGTTLKVEVVNPVNSSSVQELIEKISRFPKLGSVTLIAGGIPVSWRGPLRNASLSFLDVSGIVEIHWPLIAISARRFGRPIKRQTAAVPLQKGAGLITQELLILSKKTPPTINEIANAAQVSLSTASRTISELAKQGLVVKYRSGTQARVHVIDPIHLSERLAQRTAWLNSNALWGYFHASNQWNLATKISEKAAAMNIRLAITGRCGSAFYGVLGTALPPIIHCWIDTNPDQLAAKADDLGIELAPKEEANIGICADPWGIGTRHSAPLTFDHWTANISHPLRVWCDLHSEPRGTEFAANLWGIVEGGQFG